MESTLESSAIISPCKLYRYALRRHWNPDAGALGIVMLNPSTADGKEDDPTIRRCIGFAKENDFGGIIVGNLFAYRSTDPKQLDEVDDPVGPDNDRTLQNLARVCPHVLLAWGARGSKHNVRVDEVLRLFEEVETYTLGLTTSGQPKHPLYVASGTDFLDFGEPC